MQKSISISLIALSLMLASCGGGNSSDSDTTTNTAPIVNAGTDQTVVYDATVNLDATASDADGDALTYTWTQTSGTDITLSSTSAEDPSFTAPDQDTDIILQLSVSDGTTSTTDTVTIFVTSGTTTSADNWIVNTTERSTQIFETSTQNQGALYNVQIAEDQAEYVYIETEGIPKFDVVMTQDIINELNTRPRASTNDFASGVTTASVGETVVFGQDIGYNSNTANGSCDAGGEGYWPPGPVCPTVQGKQAFFTNTPTPNADACEAGTGPVGLYVNGTSIFNWGDGMSTGNDVWYTLAPIAEQYDVDICSGHAANGNYHLHNYSQCMADLVGDDGTAHSPIVGYAADGYPVYGPYEDNDLLAVSGWITRDYGADSSAGGCDTAGQRTCVLVDEYDLSQGVEAATSDGPDIDEVVTSLSGNSIPASDGYFYEDYYYAGATVTDAQLDQNNGHDSGDSLGYHYHHTWKVVADELTPAFPFTFGPRFYGALPANALTTCG